MVTAVRWIQKFMGRAESMLPFSTSAYLHLTTDFFLSKWKTCIRNQCPGNSEKSATESWPCLCLVPEQRVPVGGAERVPGTVLAPSTPFLLNLTSALGVLAPFHR